MKKLILVLMLACSVCFTAFAQERYTIYVSANGSADSDGASESDPTTFGTAVAWANVAPVDKIVIIGSLDVSNMPYDHNCVFSFFSLTSTNEPVDILITGKPSASGAERAVLSGIGSGKSVMQVYDSNIRIRLEHIEISGGEVEGFGLIVYRGAEVTLGPGVVIRGNADYGLLVAEDSTCIIDGADITGNRGGVLVYPTSSVTMKSGTIRNNTSRGSGGGVIIDEKGHFYMTGGSIANNSTNSTDNFVGGGVYIVDGGAFTMTGGSITNNRAQAAGGGVAVGPLGIFDYRSGTIASNTAPYDADIFREPVAAPAATYDGTLFGGYSGNTSRTAFIQEFSNIDFARHDFHAMFGENTQIANLAQITQDNADNEDILMLVDLGRYIEDNFQANDGDVISFAVKRTSHEGNIWSDGWLVYSHYSASEGWLRFVYYFAVG